MYPNTLSPSATTATPQFFGTRHLKGLVSSAAIMKRLAVEHKRRIGTHKWAAYHAVSPRVCWVTTQGRVLGVGPHHTVPANALGNEEYLVPFELPWNGPGKLLEAQLITASRQIQRTGDPNHYLYLDDDNKLARVMRSGSTGSI